MCDSGAEVNLIKLSVLRKSVLPLPIQLQIAGMCGGTGMTMGMIKLKIGQHFAIFHVMRDCIATFRSDGILGSEFFWEDGIELMYGQNQLKVGDLYFKFLPRDTCKKVSKHWLDRAKNEISESSTWQGAEMEANVGGILNSEKYKEIKLEDFNEETNLYDFNYNIHSRNFPNFPENYEHEEISEVKPFTEEFYEFNYCNFRMLEYD